jgi:nicotinamide-nucleotide amidase
MNSVEQVLQALEARGKKLAVAESLTGGMLSSNIVSVSGASKVFLGSVVAYQNEIKNSILDVPHNLLEARGAVSAEVAVAMADGAREKLSAAAGVALDRVVALSTTGVAGPESDHGKPSGTVFIALAGPGIETRAQEFSFEGSRTQVREAACLAAIEMLRDYLLG